MKEEAVEEAVEEEVEEERRERSNFGRCNLCACEKCRVFISPD